MHSYTVELIKAYFEGGNATGKNNPDIKEMIDYLQQMVDQSRAEKASMVYPRN